VEEEEESLREFRRPIRRRKVILFAPLADLPTFLLSFLDSSSISASRRLDTRNAFFNDHHQPSPGDFSSSHQPNSRRSSSGTRSSLASLTSASSLALVEDRIPNLRENSKNNEGFLDSFSHAGFPPQTRSWAVIGKSFLSQRMTRHFDVVFVIPHCFTITVF